MKFRTTAILAAICLALALGFWLVERRDAAAPQDAWQGRRVFWEPDFQRAERVGRLGLSDLAERVAVRNEHGEFTMERRPEDDHAAWRIVAPAERLADAHEVDRLLSEIEFLAPLRIVPPEPDVSLDLAEYGLDPPQATVRFSIGDKEWALWLGAETVSGEEAFAMRPDRGELMVVAGSAREIAGLGMDAFRDKRALPADAARAERLEVRLGEYALVALRKGDEWRLAEPVEDMADAREVEALLKSLAGDPASGVHGLGIEAEGFVADAPEDLAPFGLDTPLRTVAIDSAGERSALLLGAAEGGKVYAMRSGEPTVFRLDGQEVDALLSNLRRLRSGLLLDFEPAVVERVALESAGETVVAARGDRGWRLERPGPFPAEAKAVEGFLLDLASAAVSAWRDEPGEDMAAYGLAPPEAEIRLELPKGEARLALGGDAGQGAVYARRGDSGPVLLVKRSVLDDARAAHLDFLPRQMLSFPAEKAHLIEVASEGRSTRVERREGVWHMTAPVGAEADRTSVQEALWELSDMSARAVVARTPADLERYGLDSPWLVARVAVEGDEGEEQRHELRLGRSVGDTRYAKLAGGGLVFLAEPSLVRRLGQEFARRRVFGLAPEDVAALSIEHPDEGRSVRIVRKGQVWAVDGPEERAASPRAVNALLNALTGLAATRIAEYQPEDLTPYGLDRPLLVARIERSDGAGAWLRVGIGQDDAYYAQGSDTGFVCEIRESDAERLLFEP